MSNDFTPSSVSDNPLPTGTISLFIAIYLVLLAFFILLVSISHRNTHKTEDAVQSVNQTFMSTVVPLTPFSQESGPIKEEALLHSYFSYISEQARQTLMVEKIAVDVKQNRLLIQVPIERLFDRNQTILRAASNDFLALIADQLRMDESGVRMELECSVSAGQDMQPAAVQRAVAIAEALIAKDAPAKTIAVGVSPDSLALLTFRFTVRSMDEAAVRLLLTKAK